MLHDAGFREAAVTLAGQFLQRVEDGGSRPERAVAVDPQLGRKFVGGLEADAANVVGQLVRVGLDLGDGLLAVGSVDADGPPRGDAVLGQEEHQLADLFLLLPALPDPLEALLADPVDLQQELGRLLEDFQRLLLVDADDLGGDFWADAADRPGGQIFFDAFCRGRMGRLQLVGPELRSMLLVDHPATAGLDMLSCRHRRRTADDRDQLGSSLDLDPQDGEPILRVVVGDSIDQASQVFGHAAIGLLPTREASPQLDTRAREQRLPNSGFPCFHGQCPGHRKSVAHVVPDGQLRTRQTRFQLAVVSFAAQDRPTSARGES